ncbi:MAG TPA: M56 family metallopeptidase, partial [Pirellulaceae bacterium]
MNGIMSLIESLCDFVNPLSAGVCAGLLAIVVGTIDVLFRRWLSPGQRGLLWGLVLLRLMMPAAPSSYLSVQNVFANAQTEMTLPTPDYREHTVDTGGVVHSHPLPNPPVSTSQAPVTSQVTYLSVALDLFFTLLPAVWLSGAFITLIWVTALHRQFCRRLKQSFTCDDQRLCNLWQTCCQQVNLRGSIPILLFDEIEQPAILGMIRPKLLLPADATDLSDEQLRMIMLHELAHVRRWDLAANWALLVIRAIHWWNPIFWLAAARFQNLREQECDAFAVQRTEGQPRRSYGELLLALAARQRSAPPWRILLPVSILGFVRSSLRKWEIRNRLNALRSVNVTRGRWQAVAFVSLLGLVAVAGLTDARTPEMRPDYLSDWLPLTSLGGQDQMARPTIEVLQPLETEPEVTRTYDVEKVLARFVGDDQVNDHAQVQLNSLLVLILRGSTGQYDTLTDD